MSTDAEQDRIEAFMLRSRLKRLQHSLREQVYKATSRGSKKTLVPVDDLSRLLDLIPKQ